MNKHRTITAIRRALWRLRDEAVFVGEKTRLAPGAQLRLQGGGRISIGRNCRIHHGAILETHGGNIIIGDNVSINPYSIILGNGGVRIGDDTRIAAHVVVVASNHGFDDPETPIRRQPIQAVGIEIANDVWIGAGAKILDGCVIGAGGVIGAGAVVTNSIAPLQISTGVPAKVTGERAKLRDDLTMAVQPACA